MENNAEQPECYKSHRPNRACLKCGWKPLQREQTDQQKMEKKWKDEEAEKERQLKIWAENFFKPDEKEMKKIQKQTIETYQKIKKENRRLLREAEEKDRLEKLAKDNVDEVKKGENKDQ